MADTLALEDLVDKVATRFTAEGTTCEFLFGWRDTTKQLPPMPRIVWSPGDARGSVGKLGGPKYPGRLLARPLWNLDELFTATISAEDTSDPLNQRKQWKACRFLLDAWLRAIYLAAYGTVQIAGIRWVLPRKERLNGATVEVVGVIGSMVPDSDAETAPADTHANVSTTELQVTELEVVNPVP
jgi:hypothetical protein